MEGRNTRIPRAVYFQCIWVLKDIDRLRRLEAADDHREMFAEDEYIFFESDEDVVKNADVFTHAKWKLGCVRRAIEKVPEEYRQTTIDSIVYNLPFSDMAHENTWRKYRRIFIRELAQNLLLI